MNKLQDGAICSSHLIMDRIDNSYYIDMPYKIEMHNYILFIYHYPVTF